MKKIIVQKRREDLKPIHVTVKKSEKSISISYEWYEVVAGGLGMFYSTPFRVDRVGGNIWRVRADGSNICEDIVFEHCKFNYQEEIEAMRDAIKCFDILMKKLNIDVAKLVEMERNANQMNDLEEYFSLKHYYEQLIKR